MLKFLSYWLPSNSSLHFLLPKFRWKQKFFQWNVLMGTTRKNFFCFPASSKKCRNFVSTEKSWPRMFQRLEIFVVVETNLKTRMVALEKKPSLVANQPKSIVIYIYCRQISLFLLLNLHFPLFEQFDKQSVKSYFVWFNRSIINSNLFESFKFVRDKIESNEID